MLLRVLHILFTFLAIPFTCACQMTEAGAAVPSKELTNGVDSVVSFLERSLIEPSPATEGAEPSSAGAEGAHSWGSSAVDGGGGKRSGSGPRSIRIGGGGNGAVPAAAAAPSAPEVAAHALADGSGHEPLRPSVLLAHSGARWSEWTDADHSPARARLGDAAASLLFGLQYGVFVEARRTTHKAYRGSPSCASLKICFCCFYFRHAFDHSLTILFSVAAVLVLSCAGC
jgi:hypothetical protein